MGVLFGHLQRAGAYVRERNPRARCEGGDGQADAAAAGAQIQHPRVLSALQRDDDGFHQALRVLTWDEHPVVHIEAHPHKIGFLQYILHRFALNAALKAFVHLLQHFRRDYILSSY